MKRIYVFILGIMLVALMQTLVFALIPPPPANQLIGAYDTNFANLTQDNCRVCHSSGLPDRHHFLVPTKYQCMNCHPVTTNPDGSTSITIIRECAQCHGTSFNGMNIRIPHHETAVAQDRRCKTCHGDLVDDYDDGHVIPTYEISMVTPDTKYKEINTSTGKKWGGCESCHEQNTTVSPMIYNNNKTHHRLGSLSGFNPPNSSKCVTCHDTHSGQFGSDSIRYCERCHSYDSLHNIQYDYINTKNSMGYGHIGENWDCNGCHAWYEAGGMAPGTGIIIPTIAGFSPTEMLEGSSTVLTISGKDLMTTINNVTFSSVVIITDGINPITLVPSTITTDQMVVIVPALNKGVYGIYALKNGTVVSNRLAITVAPKVTISSAKKSSNAVKITGSGFGTYDPTYKSMVNVTVKSKGGTLRSVNISSWSDTSINVVSNDTVSGDTAIVNSIYGTSSARVTGK